MKDCTLIKNELMDQMVLGKKYELKDLYDMIESNYIVDDCRHKVRAVLETRNINNKYYFVYYGDEIYALERDDSFCGVQAA